MSFPQPPRGGLPPAPGGFPGNWQPSAPGPKPAGGRQWLVPTVVGVVAIAVVVTLASTLGGNSGTAGRAVADTDARTVAQTFANLESARYNAGGEDDPPKPSSAAYGNVSCRADLAEMREDDGTPPNPAAGQRLYSFAVESIEPATDGRRLLTIARTTLATKEIGDGLFYLQREGGRWKVCGLFPDTSPPDPDSGSAPSGGEPPSSGTGDDVRGFAESFAESVSTGVIPLVDTAICADDPEAKGPIEGWTNAHAHVTVQSVTVGGTGGAAHLEVTEPGQAPQSATIVVVPGDGERLCIEALAG